MKLKNYFVSIIISFFLSSAINAQDTAAFRYASCITGSSLNKHLSVLASDSLEGRETAEPGMIKAANYVASQFATMGLTPVNNTYFQTVPLINFVNAKASLKIAGKELTTDSDFFIADAPVLTSLNESEIFFAGYGIVDTLSGWKDYQTLDVSGKVVVIMDGEPIDKNGNSLITKSQEKSGWNNDRNRKIQLLKATNPKAIIFVSLDYKKVYERFKRRLEHGRLELDTEQNSKTIPVIYVSRETAGKLLEQSTSINTIEKNIARKKKPNTFTVKTPLEINIALEKTSCTNVLGFVEGNSLKDEVIIISAHLDHLGKRGDKIYYGADDDGTGCSSILEIASAFATAKNEGVGPERSILFVTFTAEEKGLLGSEYYTMNPVFPLDKTVANLNIDMIGRVDTIARPSEKYTYLIGSDKLSKQLHTINETVNGSCCQLQLDYKYNDPSDKLKLYYRSDHYNFAKNNIPVIFYFTGLHEDYHKPTDTIDKIDFDKTAAIARLVFNTAWELANRKDRIIVDVVNDFK